MADIPYDGGVDDAPEPRAVGVRTLFHVLGGVISLVLIAGLAYWGYFLAVRDVSGVPVVRALEGPMRVAPSDPGGERAEHQGLAVNAVTAEGTAAPPPDRLVLAPAPLTLEDGDTAPRSLAAEDLADVGIQHIVAPELLGDVVIEDVQQVSAEITAPDTLSEDRIPTSVGGVVRSIVPRPRPGEDLEAMTVANLVAFASRGNNIEVAPEDIPEGTRLVQLGAFDSPDVARQEWAALDERFPDFLTDKRRVIQRAESGGKVFYRLRAVGFDDINDARRFCVALEAERARCIPVVSR